MRVLTGVGTKGGDVSGVNLIVVGQISNRDQFVPIVFSLLDKKLEELLDLMLKHSVVVRRAGGKCGCGHFNAKDMAKSTMIWR